jgi:hypothetical protein
MAGPDLRRSPLRQAGLHPIAGKPPDRRTVGMRRAPWLILGLATAVLAGGATGARAQAVEPRAYSPAPTGLNFLVIGYAATKGGLSFDTSVPIENPQLSTGGPVFGYARTLDLWGRSGKVDVIVPTARLSGSAIYRGEPVSRTVEGAGDPLVRLSVLLHGGPALSPAAFRAYKPDLIVGASLQVSVPLGQYDETRLLNLGAHRWFVKPEVGISKTTGPWTWEFDAAATFFTANEDFFGGVRRSQRPLYAAQGHVVYSFRNGVWASLDATYFTGGRSSLADVLGNDLQSNWRAGATLALPVDAKNSVKLYASRGVSSRTGNDFDLLGLAWQHRWADRF